MSIYGDEHKFTGQEQKTEARSGKKNQQKKGVQGIERSAAKNTTTRITIALSGIIYRCT